MTVRRRGRGKAVEEGERKGGREREGGGKEGGRGRGEGGRTRERVDR